MNTGNLIFGIIIMGALGTGVYIYYRDNHKGGMIDSIADLAVREGTRVGRPVDVLSLRAELDKLGTAHLRVLKKMAAAYVKGDMPTYEREAGAFMKLPYIPVDLGRYNGLILFIGT